MAALHLACKPWSALSVPAGNTSRRSECVCTWAAHCTSGKPNLSSAGNSKGVGAMPLEAATHLQRAPHAGLHHPPGDMANCMDSNLVALGKCGPKQAQRGMLQTSSA